MIMAQGTQDFYFDKKAADRAARFFERYLVHIKGKWAGEPFTLEGWQKEDIVYPLFGCKRTDGSRQYRTCYIEIPRKNGKSSLCSGIALYLLYADKEASAEVYSAAADTKQAAIVFNVAKGMETSVAAPADQRVNRLGDGRRDKADHKPDLRAAGASRKSDGGGHQMHRRATARQRHQPDGVPVRAYQ